MSPSYVLDEMSSYEISPLLERILSKKQDMWERARFTSLPIVQSFSTKKIKPTDIAIFPWDKPDPDEVVSDKEKDRVFNKMKKYINGFSNKTDIKQQ
ncbi:hypothetical protein [Parabacteroides sp. Marseille-P3160]|uniref:hypothetical protein n=1 Tax=Parabacteroides sp. Marseille-P3160 TaxID=1917887 RepID=UPI0009BAA770|nr:hypothetical protein [Parabacteroides sp. Marseille-P3160]